MPKHPSVRFRNLFVHPPSRFSSFLSFRIFFRPFSFHLSRKRGEENWKIREEDVIEGERGRVSGGSGVGRDKRAKLLGPARLEICKSGVIRLDIRSVHGTNHARIGKFDTERERGGWW